MISICTVLDYTVTYGYILPLSVDHYVIIVFIGIKYMLCSGIVNVVFPFFHFIGAVADSNDFLACDTVGIFTYLDTTRCDITLYAIIHYVLIIADFISIFPNGDKSLVYFNIVIAYLVFSVRFNGNLVLCTVNLVIHSVHNSVVVVTNLNRL